MAKLRTRNQARVRREAKAFLKAAAQDADQTKHKKLTHGLHQWVKQAELEPVFQFLTS